jgi:hypothetical protein
MVLEKTFDEIVAEMEECEYEKAVDNYFDPDEQQEDDEIVEPQDEHPELPDECEPNEQWDYDAYQEMVQINKIEENIAEEEAYENVIKALVFDDVSGYTQNAVVEANEETNATATELVNTSGGTEWTAFMGHIPHTEFEYLKYEMEKLEAPYVMSAEAGKYEHFHFLAKITKRQYHNFVMKNFKAKYNLRGRAHNGHPRQYGKVNKIKDLSKMMAYTVKDKNYVSNMTKNQIEYILKKKIEDVENTKNSNSGEIKEKMIKYVNNHINENITNKKYIDSRKMIRMIIIDFMIEHKISIIRTTIERYYYYYIAHTDYDTFKETSKSIYDELYEV